MNKWEMEKPKGKSDTYGENAPRTDEEVLGINEGNSDQSIGWILHVR